MTRKLLFFVIFLLAGTSAFSQIPPSNPDSIPFAPKVDYAVGSHPFSVFCADLDGDHDLDLVVVNSNDNNVSILKNNGNGTFGSAVNYPTASDPAAVFCADLNGDSSLDLAVACWSDTVSILINNGDGIFRMRSVIRRETGPGVCSVQIWTGMAIWTLPSRITGVPESRFLRTTATGLFKIR
ncbi:MAG: FG-GAP-like repeat-containing protein [Candidatus Zixiibacteriota bacterium]